MYIANKKFKAVSEKFEMENHCWVEEFKHKSSASLAYWVIREV